MRNKTKQEIEMLDSIRSPSEELKQDCFLASSGHGGEVLHTFTMPQDTISELMPVNLLCSQILELTFTQRIQKHIAAALK